MIVDSHCHLIHEKNTLSIDEIIDNAKNNNVCKLLNISTQKDDFEQCIKLSETYKDVYTSIGIHPHESNQMNEYIYQKIFELSSHNKVVGIGETGLDYFYNHSKKKSQIDSFLQHIKVSQLTNLPLIIHMRDAEEDMIEIIEKEYKKKPFSGVIHCFTGSLSFAEKLLKIGFYFSVSGIITFKNSNDLRDTVSNIPMNKIMIETDSPYLSPVPVRGTVNQPANILHTLEYMSKLYNLDLENFRDISTNNFFNLFKKAI